MNQKSWERILASLALTAPIPYVAQAATYLTEDQAAAALLPGIRLEPRWVDLTAAEIKIVQKSAKERVIDPHVRVLWGPDHEAVIVDKVVGKHEFITYAIAIGADGKILGVEIMDYRETFGDQVRGKAWRGQFIGKDKSSPLKVDKDIQNISGATLSSVHVTNGVRRVLQTYEILRQRS